MTYEPVLHPGVAILGAAIRRQRFACELTASDIALRMGIEHTIVSRWETGKRRITADNLRWFLALIDTPPADYHFLISLHKHSENSTHIEHDVTGVTRLHHAYYRHALHIFDWAPRIVPDVLQTTDYARAVIAPHTTGPGQVDEHIRTRQALRPAHNPDRWHTVLLGEAALNLGTVPRDVLRAQMRLLTNPVKHPRQKTQIVPARFADTIEPFTIYMTAAKDYTVVLRDEHTTTYLSDPSTVERYQKTFTTLKNHATDYTPTNLQQVTQPPPRRTTAT